MSLFAYCLIATLTAFVLGRANRSITLFWQLLIAFGIGAIGAAIVQKCTTSDEEKTNVVTVLTPETGVPATIPFMSKMTELNALNAPTATFIAAQVSRATVRDNNMSCDNLVAASGPEGIRGQPWVAMGTYDTS